MRQEEEEKQEEKAELNGCWSVQEEDWMRRKITGMERWEKIVKRIRRRGREKLCLR